MTTKTRASDPSGQKIQDGGHGGGADGSVVSGNEFSSAKKIRGVRRSLYAVAKEKSLRSGIKSWGNQKQIR